MSMAGGHDRAVRSAHAVGFSTVQVFTKSNNQWRAAPLTDAHVAAFRAALDETGVSDPVAHASYLINLGSPDDALWEKSIASLALEIETRRGPGDRPTWSSTPGRTSARGRRPGWSGSRGGSTRSTGGPGGWPSRSPWRRPPGRGPAWGTASSTWASLLDRVAEPERLGVCVDTCHIFAAGYPLGTDSEYDGTMAGLERAVGPGRVRVWHLNDSLKPLGSRVDRHAGLGRGHIGLEPFRRVVNDPRHRDIPMILETPKGEEEGEDLDAVNLRLLRGLVEPSPVNA